MPNANNEAQRFYQNLIDAGCSNEIVNRCVNLRNAGEENELLLILGSKRKELLDNIHCFQERLDCLDYLMYRLNKKDLQGG